MWLFGIHLPKQHSAKKVIESSSPRSLSGYLEYSLRLVNGVWAKGLAQGHKATIFYGFWDARVSALPVLVRGLLLTVREVLQVLFPGSGCDVRVTACARVSGQSTSSVIHSIWVSVAGKEIPQTVVQPFYGMLSRQCAEIALCGRTWDLNAWNQNINSELDSECGEGLGIFKSFIFWYFPLYFRAKVITWLIKICI